MMKYGLLLFCVLTSRHEQRDGTIQSNARRGGHMATNAKRGRVSWGHLLVGKSLPVHNFHPAFIAFPSVIMLSHMAPSSVIMLSILATSPTGMAFMAGPRAHTVQRAPEARMAVLEPGSKVLVTGKGPVMLLAAKLAAVQVLHLGIPASP